MASCDFVRLAGGEENAQMSEPNSKLETTCCSALPYRTRRGEGSLRRSGSYSPVSAYVLRSSKGGKLGLAGQTRFNRVRIYSIRFACACEWHNPDSKCHVKGGTVSYGIYVCTVYSMSAPRVQLWASSVAVQPQTTFIDPHAI